MKMMKSLLRIATSMLLIGLAGLLPMDHCYASDNPLNNPPTAICKSSGDLIDQDHNLTFGGQGVIFNSGGNEIDYFT